jgi:hypothetical protein
MERAGERGKRGMLRDVVFGQLEYAGSSFAFVYGYDVGVDVKESFFSEEGVSGVRDGRFDAKDGREGRSAGSEVGVIA